MKNCYHCAEPVPHGEHRAIEIDGHAEFLCCAGCEAVTRLILDAGFADFYRFRTAPAPRARKIDSGRWSGFDDAAVLDIYAPLSGDERELRVQLDNLRCAACGWLVEKTLREQHGVCDIRLNIVTGRATLRWRPQDIPLGSLLASLDRLGFDPHPLRADETFVHDDNRRKTFLKRLAVAGLGMMQVMMYGVAMYIGAFEDMDAGMQQFLRYVSSLIATPVVLYSAAPFFQGAWRDIRHASPGMDVPVALAIAAAYSASLWHTFTGTGEVYFDSVSMFVFFLLIGRYVEFAARHEVAAGSNALAATLPATAERIATGGVTAHVPLTLLKPGDRIRITNGSIVPADGILLDERAELDEALLTGESAAVLHERNDKIIAGTINRGSPFVMQVLAIGRETVISGIHRMLELAQQSRPQLASHADRIARWFVAGVLAAAAITAFAWWQLSPERAFEITLSVLVVTCPCALALAVPVALTAATDTLARHGLLTVNSNSLEWLPKVTDIIFDKTGTLTQGEPRIVRTLVCGERPEIECLQLAAGLEAQANHPIARAFRNLVSEYSPFTQVHAVPGRGLRGISAGVEYRIGIAAFALDNDNAENSPQDMPGSWIALANDAGPLAWFEIEDSVRAEAHGTLKALRRSGYALHLLTGDSPSAANAIADLLEFSNCRARQTPEQKLAYLRALQSQGRRVLVIGDGCNDAPVLAGADVSVALAGGASLAHASADVLLTGKLSSLLDLLSISASAARIMRQNLYWAIAYNAVALPLAAIGLVAPWMAAIGMSASSLLVTVNALRIARTRPGESPNMQSANIRELSTAST